ncbi:MAG: hypothetical protein EXR91_02095 [Gemmatimonadetes bacterium]|nr:hypothetical protein [Gemmatimonadota bacterium]
MPTSMGPRRARNSAPRAALLALLVAPTGLLAQAAPADSADVLEEMHDLQEEFERYRESRTPVQPEPTGGACDERIGRICIWFGGEEEERFPAELREVGQARVELIRSLFDAFEQVHDRWILGQLVHYLVENRTLDEAERVATECGVAEAWWCSALLGYTLHVRAEYIEAEVAFREAIAAMPQPLRDEWMSPRYVFTPDVQEEFDLLPPAEREARWNLLWRLSDPLFLIEGNDYFTDHYARWVLAENRRESAEPLGLEWAEDLDETLVRYGRNTGYSRTQNRIQFGLQDNRRMVGHHHPKSRGYLFPEQFLSSPSDILPESWITAPREARTWYAPPYAPDIRGLETQLGRFRRDERMLVVGAYRPTREADDGRVVSAWGPSGGIEGAAFTALFLVPEDGEEPRYVRGSEPEGVLSIEAPPGRYVGALEVVDLQGRQAWRARQGVVQRPLEPGMVDVSDLMILEEGAPLPESLEEAMPHLRPGVRLRPGERFPVLWEAYGLRVSEPVRVTIGFSQGRPGFLARVGDFLGVLEPAQPVDITFDDSGPDGVQYAFRAVELELPDLDPGEYTLHLRLELPGRTPVVTSRPILVEDVSRP